MKNIQMVSILLLGFLVSCGTSQKTVTPSDKKNANTMRAFLKGETFFEDDFENYGLGQTLPAGKWKVGFARSGGSAKIMEGVQFNGKIGKILRGDAIIQVFVPGSWKDFEYSLYWKEGEPLIYFKLDSIGSKGYYLLYEKNKPFQLYKFTSAGKFKIAENSLKISDQWHHLQIYVKDNKIIIYVDKQKIIDITDDESALARGGIGLGKTYYYPVYFDNVTVQEIK